MNIHNLTLVEVADVLDAWSETEERKLPYLSGVDKDHARNCAINFAWLRDQIRNRIQQVSGGLAGSAAQSNGSQS